jgi:CheY-like chemotaxis protein
MATDPHILYIEDERPVLELARWALNLSGYKLSAAISGQQGLTMMRQRKPDLLLLDLMMRDFNGWDVYREIKNDAQLADIPVIVVTATSLEHSRTIIDDLPPVDGFITKPFDVDRLIRSVERYL